MVVRNDRIDYTYRCKNRLIIIGMDSNPILSDREVEVMDLISQGLTDKEISAQLVLSSNTVKTHRKNIIFKLGCKNACAMVRRAFELKLL